MYRQHSTQQLARVMAMSEFSSNFIAFSKRRMESQGDEIRKWSKSNNPLLSQTCKEIMEAAERAEWKHIEREGDIDE